MIYCTEGSSPNIPGISRVDLDFPSTGAAYNTSIAIDPSGNKPVVSFVEVINVASEDYRISFIGKICSLSDGRDRASSLNH